MAAQARTIDPRTWNPLVLTGALFVVFAAVLLGVAYGLYAAFTDGSSSSKAAHYTLAPSRACLAAKGYRPTTRGLDFVATTALGGALRARLPDNKVEIVFAGTPDGAARILEAYHNFAPKGFPVDSVLTPQGDAVLLWAKGPQQPELRAITGCLR